MQVPGTRNENTNLLRGFVSTQTDVAENTWKTSIKDLSLKKGLLQVLLNARVFKMPPKACRLWIPHIFVPKPSRFPHQSAHALLLLFFDVF